MYSRGWTDGLPVVPPTEARVLAMLDGTTRRPDEIVAVVPPNLVAGHVEKVAVNAVLAGCRPEYLPLVLAAVEAACTDEFNIHGVLATTWFVGPVVVVNGPSARAIGNELRDQRPRPGQPGQRHHRPGPATASSATSAAAGRAGSTGPPSAPPASTASVSPRTRPARRGSRWRSSGASPPDVSTVTVFAGGGVHGVADQQSRTPESLARSLAGRPARRRPSQAGAGLGRLPGRCRPTTAGCSARRAGRGPGCASELAELLTVAASTSWSAGSAGIEEGIPAAPGRRRHCRSSATVGCCMAYAGGGAGLFSAIIDGWAGRSER